MCIIMVRVQFMCVVLIHSSHVQWGWTALMRAANNGHTAIVQYLVEETTAQVNATDNVSHSNSVKCIIVHWVLVHKHKYHW